MGIKQFSKGFIEENICKSIEILVKKYIADAKIDKIIKAQILNCINAEDCRYVCKYQDTKIIATSNLPKEFPYKTGSTVYILIPQGDLSNGGKLILGEVK